MILLTLTAVFYFFVSGFLLRIIKYYVDDLKQPKMSFLPFVLLCVVLTLISVYTPYSFLVLLLFLVLNILGRFSKVSNSTAFSLISIIVSLLFFFFNFSLAYSTIFSESVWIFASLFSLALGYLSGWFYRDKCAEEGACKVS